MTGPVPMLGGLVLLCGFLLLAQRRLGAMVALVRAQAVLVAVGTAWQGAAQGADGLYLAALLTLVCNAVLLPAGLRRIVRQSGLADAVPVRGPMLLGVALAGVAVLAVPGALAGLPARQGLAVALAVVLLGVLLLAARREALAQAIGLLAAANGLVLAAVGMPGMPLVAGMAVALPVLAGCLLAGVVLLRMPPPIAGVVDQAGPGR